MKKTMIVTGGSSGIGLAIAKKFLEAGYRVFNLDIIPSEVGEYLECDVCNKQKLLQCIEAISSKHLINVLVSNAGMHFSANIENTSEVDFDKVLNLNVKASYLVTKAIVPSMKRNNGGVIIYIGSDQSTVGKTNSFVYNLSKHALASMAKTMALDYASYNIRANTICAGTIETPLYHKAIEAYCDKSGEDKAKIHALEAAEQPLGRIGQADEVAALALFLASDDASFITGSLHAIDGGYTAR